jgi:hypothetical protein
MKKENRKGRKNTHIYKEINIKEKGSMNTNGICQC